MDFKLLVPRAAADQNEAIERRIAFLLKRLSAYGILQRFYDDLNVNWKSPVFRRFVAKQAMKHRDRHG